MKKDELIALGLTEDQAKSVLEINGADIEHAKAIKDKAIGDLTLDRDGLQTRLTAAETTLKRFEGIDPEKIQQEIQTYKQQAEETERKFTRELMQRDQKDWVKAKLDEYGVKSPLARRQITTEVMSETNGLKWKPAEDGKPGTFYGFDDYMKAAKAEDETLYQTAEEKAGAEKQASLEKKAPIFTGPSGEPAPAGEKYTPPKIF